MTIFKYNYNNVPSDYPDPVKVYYPIYLYVKYHSNCNYNFITVTGADYFHRDLSINNWMDRYNIITRFVYYDF